MFSSTNELYRKYHIFIRAFCSWHLDQNVHDGTLKIGGDFIPKMISSTLNLQGELSRTNGHARVWLDNIGKSRNRSWNSLCTEESKDSKLGKTAIVQFSSKALLLGFFRQIGVEFEGIVEVEGHRVGNTIKGREFTWCATLGVVDLSYIRSRFRCKLTPELKETNEENDLNLRSERKSIPLLRRGKIGP